MNKIKVIQKYFIKIILKKKQHTYPSDQLYKEIGILDIT